jgi:hypothetical protein
MYTYIFVYNPYPLNPIIKLGMAMNYGSMLIPQDLKHVHVCGCINTYICIYIYTYTYAYIYICTHIYMYITPTPLIFFKLGLAMNYGPMLIPQDLKHLPLNKTEVNKSLNVQIYTYIST